MKTKTKTKQVKDLLYPCYFTVARPQFEEGVDPLVTIKLENKSLLESNEYFKVIQEQNEKTLQEFMYKADAEVSDEDFFDLLRYSPVVLSSRFAQEKISRWQCELHDPDSSVSFNADEKLRKISSVLVLRGKHRPDIILNAAFMKDFFCEYLDQEEFMQAFEEKSGITIREDPTIASLYVDIQYDRKNLPKLLNLIIARVMGLQIGTVKQYLKQVIEVYEGDHKIGYAIEVRSPEKEIPSLTLPFKR